MSGQSKPKLCGAHVWAQWQMVKPRYTLWEYQGPAVAAGGLLVHHFMPYKQKGSSMYLTMEHLERNAAVFRPFCFSTDELPGGL